MTSWSDAKVTTMDTVGRYITVDTEKWKTKWKALCPICNSNFKDREWYVHKVFKYEVQRITDGAFYNYMTSNEKSKEKFGDRFLQICPHCWENSPGCHTCMMPFATGGIMAEILEVTTAEKQSKDDEKKCVDCAFNETIQYEIPEKPGHCHVYISKCIPYRKKGPKFKDGRQHECSHQVRMGKYGRIEKMKKSRVRELFDDKIPPHVIC
jgi:hypothetical protein